MATYTAAEEKLLPHVGRRVVVTVRMSLENPPSTMIFRGRLAKYSVGKATRLERMFGQGDFDWFVEGTAKFSENQSSYPEGRYKIVPPMVMEIRSKL